MDSSSEYADNPAAPETRAQKISHVAELLKGQYDDEPAPAESNGDDSGGDVPATDDRGELPASESLEVPEPDAVDGVEDDTEEDATPDTTDSDPDAPVTLSSLAEHLGVESADVYELEIPIGAGLEPVTLGQLKDEYKEYGPVKEFKAELEGKSAEFEKSVLQTRAELNAIVNAIPEEIRAQVISAGRAHQKQWAQSEEEAVLEAIPEWRDADTLAKERAMLFEDGAEYGFSEAEMAYTQDSRTLRMLRDFSKMKRELEGIKTASKKVPGKAGAPLRAGQSKQSNRKLAQAIRKAKADPTMQGKAQVVSQLIRNQNNGNK